MQTRGKGSKNLKLLRTSYLEAPQPERVGGEVNEAVAAAAAVTNENFARLQLSNLTELYRFLG